MGLHNLIKWYNMDMKFVAWWYDMDLVARLIQFVHSVLFMQAVADLYINDMNSERPR